MVGKLILIILLISLLVLTEVWINTFLYRSHQNLKWLKFAGAEAGTVVLLALIGLGCHWLKHFKVINWIVNVLDSIWLHFISYLPHWHIMGFSISPILVWLCSILIVAYIYFFIAGLIKRHEIIHHYTQWQKGKEQSMLKGDQPTYKEQLPNKEDQDQAKVKQPAATKASNTDNPIAAKSQQKKQVKSVTQPASTTNPHFLSMPTTKFDYHSRMGIQQAFNRAKQGGGLIVMSTDFGYVALYANANGLSALKSAIAPTPLERYQLPNSPSLVQFTTTKLQAITLSQYVARLA